MKTFSTSEIGEALRAVGLCAGNVAMIHSDISRIGWTTGASSRDAVLADYLTAITDVLGSDGTVVTLACTESYARSKKPFDYETSPSEQGVFSEYVRANALAIRSMHPLFSLAALGPAANAICGDDVAPTGFGYGSPFHRLHEMDAIAICLGVDLRSLTFVHHVEQTYGVPYGYTKEWTAPVTRGGKPEPGRFFAFVRYLDAGVEYDFSRMQEALLDEGLARHVPIGYGGVWSVRVRDVFDLGMRRLRDDPFFFLKQAPEQEPWKR